MAAVRIEHRELAGSFQQRLVLVLAVDFDQQFGQRLQLCQCRRAAIDPGARVAFAADHTAQLAIGAVIELLGFEPSLRGGRIAEGKFRAQFRTLAAMAHDAGVRALPRQQQQGIEQDRLARAGLAGDDGEACAERDLCFADDGEVLDVEGFSMGAETSTPI